MSFIAKAYVDWLQSAGAQVVPIPADIPLADLRQLYVVCLVAWVNLDTYPHRSQQLDGALFPGGTSSLANSSAYMQTVKNMVDIAVQLNNDGQYFPLWGTCLGFQALAIALTGNNTVRTNGFNSFNLASKTKFVSPLPVGARLLRVLTPDVRQQMKRQKLVYNNHKLGTCCHDRS